MEEKSWKNILQEYCQKNGLDMPVYNTTQLGIIFDSNTIIWKSVLNKDVSGIDTTKRNAENRAAALLMNYLNSNSNSNNSGVVNRKQKVIKLQDIDFTLYNRVVLVDGENCDFEMDKFEKTTLVCIFVAKNTSKNIVFVYQEKYENCYVFVSDSVGRDAADHLLTFSAGILSIINPASLYYILTKDHYGEFLEKFMKNCKFICSTEEI